MKNRLHVNCLCGDFVVYNHNKIIQKLEIITPIPDSMIPMNGKKGVNILLLMSWYRKFKCFKITKWAYFIYLKPWEWNDLK